MENAEQAGNNEPFDATKITRPDDSLLRYYFLVSLCAFIAFPLAYIPYYIRFKTMKYRFDESGVSMSWGFFFRKEVHLTYGRLQDIHVTRNIVERWMGLAKLPIQTASGTAGATMTIEGIRNPEPLREFLYLRMRGAKGRGYEGPEQSADKTIDGATGEPQTGPQQAGVPEANVTELLMAIRDELRSRNQTKDGNS